MEGAIVSVSRCVRAFANTLQHLDMAGWGMTRISATTLMQSLSSTTSPVQLDLRPRTMSSAFPVRDGHGISWTVSCPVHSLAVASIDVPSFDGSISLEELSISGGLHMYTAMHGNVFMHLHKLDLSGCVFLDGGFLTILASNFPTTIRHLSMSRCVEGAMARGAVLSFFIQLPSSTSLEMLDLADLRIQPSVQYIELHLAHSLRPLRLHDLRLGHLGLDLRQFFKIDFFPTTLRHLDLRHRDGAGGVPLHKHLQMVGSVLPDLPELVCLAITMDHRPSEATNSLDVLLGMGSNSLSSLLLDTSSETISACARHLGRIAGKVPRLQSCAIRLY